MRKHDKFCGLTAEEMLDQQIVLFDIMNSVGLSGQDTEAICNALHSMTAIKEAMEKNGKIDWKKWRKAN